MRRRALLVLAVLLMTGLADTPAPPVAAQESISTFRLLLAVRDLTLLVDHADATLTQALRSDGAAPAEAGRIAATVITRLDDLRTLSQFDVLEAAAALPVPEERLQLGQLIDYWTAYRQAVRDGAEAVVEAAERGQKRSALQTAYLGPGRDAARAALVDAFNAAAQPYPLLPPLE